MTGVIFLVGLLVALVLALLAVLLAGRVMRMFGGDPLRTVRAARAIVPGLWKRWKTTTITGVSAILVAATMWSILPVAGDALSWRGFLASNEGRAAKVWCSTFASMHGVNMSLLRTAEPSRRAVEREERECLDAKWREWRRQ